MGKLIEFDKILSRFFFNQISFVFWILSISVIFFGEHLLGKQVTLWDTHDLGYVNFLYFSDSIGSGYIPFWNPFIQAGVFFPSLNNAGFFTFFQIPFALIAQVLNPVVVYEWLIQFYLLTAGIGAYFYFSILNVQKPVAIFASISFLMILIHFTGQLSFIISLSSLFWLLYVYHLVDLGKLKLLQIVLVGVILGSYIVSAYPWMNFVNFAILSIYTLVLGRRSDKWFNDLYKKIFLFIFTTILIYLLYMMPGILNLILQYDLFWGDLTNYEPRLRSLGIQIPAMYYTSLTQAIINSIDPLFAKTGHWARGTGIIVFFLLLNSFFRGIKLDKLQAVWWSVIVFFLVYSAAPTLHLLDIVNFVPFFNANRWFAAGLLYVCISIVVLASYRFNLYFGKDQKYFHLITLFLIVGNIMYFYILHNPSNGTHTFSFDKSSEQVADNRVKIPVYDGNERIQHESQVYIFNDEWVLNKIPSTHGYNNLGNPWYWSFKNTEIFKNIISLTRQVKVIQPLNRSYYLSDNKFYDAYVKEILEGFPRYSLFKNIVFSVSGGEARPARQGNAGGSGNSGYNAGGGGGAEEAGSDSGVPDTGGGDGGDGTANSITGSSVIYAGGGGGGSDYDGSSGRPAGGIGGTGGGGNGASGAEAALAGSANLGGGGGGAAGNGSATIAAAAGGSGIVIISYPSPQRFTGGTITTSGSNIIHKFTSSGSLSSRYPITSLVVKGVSGGNTSSGGGTDGAVTSRDITADYLVVAGGGGGGSGSHRAGGGGGGGGYLAGTTTLSSDGSYAVTVGIGGAVNAAGSNSVFKSITGTGGAVSDAEASSVFKAITAIGGGSGGTHNTPGGSGGSGGGAGELQSNWIKGLEIENLSVQTTPNETRAQVTTNNSAILSFNTPYDPSWEAYINGEQVDIIKVNGFFMGIFLSKAGQYNIEFKYRPYFVYILYGVTYLILIVISILNFRFLKKIKGIS